jgi:hypothetical protein
MKTEQLFGNRKIHFEYLSLQEIISLHWSLGTLFNWCRGAKYLRFAGHPLQNDFGPFWDHDQFVADLRELCKDYGKRAFPPHQAVGAAFTQDKWEIYEALSDMMLPSFQIKRPSDPDRTVTDFDESVLSDLYEYVSLLHYYIFSKVCCFQ